jgi:Predicted membrane protein/domain
VEHSEVEYAGFWARTGAALIDTLLSLLITLPLVVGIYGWSYFDPEQTGFIAGPADFLITWVLPAIVVITFWIMRQATPGKMAISARIVDATTGQPASTGQLVGRYFAYFVSMIPLCLGFFWVAFDRKKQGWHDRLAETVVVRNVRRGPEPVSFEKPGGFA